MKPKKVSDRLEQLTGRGEKSAPVTIRLAAGLPRKKLDRTVRAVQSRLLGAEYLAVSGTVHGTLPLADVAAVSDLPEVEWIDVEPTATTAELIDPM